MTTLHDTLITGANGFIGRRLVEHLLDNGERVRALIRPDQQILLQPHQNLTLVRGDVTDPPSIIPAVRGCEIVYHLASVVALTHRHPEQFEEVNVRGTENVLKACRGLGVRRVMICSSCGIFGPASDGVPITETKPVDRASWGPYEASKFRQVELAQVYRSDEMGVSVAYPTRVFGAGPSSQANAVAILIRRIAKGKTFFFPGDGNAIGNYVAVEDVAKGMRLIMELGRSGEGYILGGYDLTYRELFSCVKNISHSRARACPMPTWILKSIARIDELTAPLFRRTPWITRRAIAKYTANWPVSIAKSQRELGYEPANLELSIKKTIKWG